MWQFTFSIEVILYLLYILPTCYDNYILCTLSWVIGLFYSAILIFILQASNYISTNINKTHVLIYDIILFQFAWLYNVKFVI